MSKASADRAFAKTGLTGIYLLHLLCTTATTGLKPSDVQVVELHDCFSANELITYEALGLCAPGQSALKHGHTCDSNCCTIGKAGEMIDAGDNTYGGKYVVNPSGGLISKGHPLGATGMDGEGHAPATHRDLRTCPVCRAVLAAERSGRQAPSTRRKVSCLLLSNIL